MRPYGFNESREMQNLRKDGMDVQDASWTGAPTHIHKTRSAAKRARRRKFRKTARQAARKFIRRALTLFTQQED